MIAAQLADLIGPEQVTANAEALTAYRFDRWCLKHWQDWQGEVLHTPACLARPRDAAQQPAPKCGLPRPEYGHMASLLHTHFLNMEACHLLQNLPYSASNTLPEYGVICLLRPHILIWICRRPDGVPSAAPVERARVVAVRD